MFYNLKMMYDTLVSYDIKHNISFFLNSFTSLSFFCVNLDNKQQKKFIFPESSKSDIATTMIFSA